MVLSKPAPLSMFYDDTSFNVDVVVEHWHTQNNQCRWLRTKRILGNQEQVEQNNFYRDFANLTQHVILLHFLYRNN